MAAPVDGSALDAFSVARGERVAVVDDEAAMATVTLALLQRLGYGTSSYNSAARFYKHFDAAPDRFSLVITDVVMPGMSGLQLVRALREAGHNVPVLLMTGYSMHGRLDTDEFSGRVAFIRKPFTSVHLAQSVRRLLCSTR